MLHTLLALPLLGVVLIALLPVRWTRVIALMTAGVTLAFSLVLLVSFDLQEAAPQLFETHRWNPRLGSAFSLAIDGFSLPMILLATLLVVISVLASGGIRTRQKGYYALILMLESAMLGVFSARDWSLFYVFWELTLIPLFFLIDRYGGVHRSRAALNFVLYTMGGSTFMLIALLMLYDLSAAHSFDMTVLRETGRSLPAETQAWLFAGLLIGFGVKMPIFPLHGWLPLAHVEAPSPVSILLSGILLKMGSYGLIRAASALPAGAQVLQPLLVALGLISLIYGGVLAWQQRDLKKMVAYSSFSHMGVVLLGIASLNALGFTGAIVQMVAHGLVAGALFLLIGLLYERTHTRDIGDYASLVRVMPRFAFFTVLALVAAVGFPGTVGFVAELHVLLGAFDQFGLWAALLSLGVLISAAYALRTVGRLFTGPISPTMQQIPDLTRTEFMAAAVLTSGILVLGVFPMGLLALVSPSVERLARLFGA
ncbi:MAG: NADH-quinone oxidoreductase subunit M [Betaproteobacteria bacterium]|nr:MAG: NADH-quinone oxidoreductase subunit M [Betaproteobacteria bacterium]